MGGCDLYSTKATGSDKKLYKSIDRTLEEQHESLVRFSASLSPPEAISAAVALNLNRDSPFGRLSQNSAKRTFAYLVATMNASHNDYDFSSSRPEDFRNEKSLKAVMDALDTTLYNLRPTRCKNYQTGPPHWFSSVTPAGPPTPTPSQKWSPKMWRAIDNQMQLKACSIYSYAPKDDPFDAEEGALWSFNYLFFNKSRKRVCYVYLRGLSFMNPDSSAGLSPLEPQSREWDSDDLEDYGADKRARYWLGERAASRVRQQQRGWDEDEEDYVARDADADEHEHELRLLSEGEARRFKRTTAEAGSPPSGRSRSRSPRGRSKSALRSRSVESRSKSAVRGLSEDVVESMEV